MTSPTRMLLFVLSLASVAAGVGLLIAPASSTVLAWVVIAAGSALAGVTATIPVTRRKKSSSRDTKKKAVSLVEVDDIRALEESRRRELIRGASKQLADFQYRYSVRMHNVDTGEHRCFNADVNGVHLGFIPAIITDNTNDRQGYGYVAFVHDGNRWRGPGLPCPAGQMEAVRHASRCVSPLSTEEETKFEESRF
ncbi:MAG: hypothetical protein AAF432_08595 [Planctomycetota bacterium]